MLLLSRDAGTDKLNELIVVPRTRTVRGIATEVLLSSDDGMPTVCALNFDHVSLAQRARLGPILKSSVQVSGGGETDPSAHRERLRDGPASRMEPDLLPV